MAKLTARFDMQDRISKKIRTIRGEVERLEKARVKVNKPVTMTMIAKDKATKILKKLHIFVLKDIAKTHTVAVKVKDQATKSLNAISNFMKRRMPRTHAVFVSAKDKASPILQRINRFAQRNIARTQLMTVLALDRAMPTIRRIGDFARLTLSKGYSFTVRAADMASRVIGRVSSYVATAIPKVRTFTIRAINGAMGVISSVKRALFSIPAVITVTLAAVGVGKFTEATAGAAMNFEGYRTSMEHWLGGNQKEADKLVTWMGQFADTTPFSSPDLFPALATGVGIAGGNVGEAQRLLKIATDMAALTPGRTVSDAMDALGSAQMGNFVNLKSFGMRVLDEDYKAMGGWTGFLDEVGTKFEDGALKLSKTSAGILATLKGYRSSIFRSIGEGMLEPMKPRLDAINKWLENNQETWGRWKNTVKSMGQDASEWVFTKLENGFMHIKSNYLENDNFKKLDFEGKIKFISEDIGQWWSSKGKPALSQWWESSGKPWAEEIGLFVGKSIFEGIVTGIKEGGKALGGMWKDAFKDPSLGAFGGAGVASAIALALSSLVLSPLIKGISLITKIVQGAWGLGKKVAGLFGKGKPPVIPPGGGKPPNKPPASGGRGGDGGRGGGFGRIFGGNKPPNTPPATPDYRHPWFNKGAKPDLNVPNKVLKTPKGLSKLANFGKRVPVLGTLLGGVALATAPKEDKAGVAGGISGGLAGAAAGAAVGSVVPVVGTTIGGILGGILGSMGGAAIGDWFSDNWSSIKQGASDAGKWVSDTWDTTWTAVGNGASAVGEWISEKVGGASEWVSDKWSSASEWFNQSVWTPIEDAGINSINFLVGLFDIGREWASEKWQEFSGWFDETVWTPVKEGAAIAGEWISDKYIEAKEWVSENWSAFSGWFDETVWEPIKLGAAAAGLWISEKYNESKEWIGENWSAFSGWFDETVWQPVKEGAGIAAQWISDSTLR